MREDGRPDAATESFVVHRNLLFTVALRDARIGVRRRRRPPGDLVAMGRCRSRHGADRRAYLVRITTRQALTRLRTLGRRKESYVGVWLPEPLLTAPDVAEDVALADSVSMAMLLVLETLGPTERAVFVLREVFDFGYDEIAQAVDKKPAAVRQIAHRARAHVAARRPRDVASPTQTRAALEALQRAFETGDLQSLLDILAPDVVALGDGGGVKQAVPRPVVGADRVARLVAVGWDHVGAQTSFEPVQVNGCPALIMRLHGELDGVMAVRVEDGLIAGLYYVRNPRSCRAWNGKRLSAAEPRVDRSPAAPPGLPRQGMGVRGCTAGSTSSGGAATGANPSGATPLGERASGPGRRSRATAVRRRPHRDRAGRPASACRRRSSGP